MKKTYWLMLASLSAALSLGLAACGGSSSSSGSTSNVAYNAGATSVVNPSTHTGGTVTYVNPTDWDSIDPGNTYYGYSWDFSRLYARTLLTYQSKPGSAGLQLVPDLATGLGQVSADGLTWTYHIKPNIKFSNGATVTTQDIKYAIERTASYTQPGKPAVLPNGPIYWGIFLKDPTYPGAYYDNTPGKMGLTGISTPNATTIVFNLRKPMAEFNYLATLSQTSPVPPSADSGANGGANYLKHMVTTGPYVFQSVQVGKQYVLVKNPYWSAATDPNVKQYANKIVANVNVNASTLDNELFSGQADIDVSGTGVSPADQARVLTNPSLKQNADDVLDGFFLYTAINTKVAPFNNPHCREAVLYAADHASLQTAYGGTYGGQLATQVLPPQIGGYIPGYDPYGFKTQPTGNLTAAKQQLSLCGKPSGFSTTITERQNRPKEDAGALALQASLARVGIKASIYSYPAGNISSVVGTPNFVHQHGLGLMMHAWGPDWPAGFGFLNAIVNGAAITPAGNYNLAELNDPVVNADLDNVMADNSMSGRSATYSAIDKQVMNDAVILPIAYEKALLYRNPQATNVYYNPALLMFDYGQIGVK